MHSFYDMISQQIDGPEANPDAGAGIFKSRFNIEKSNDDKMLAFGWASAAVRSTGKQIEDWQEDIIDPEDPENAAYGKVTPVEIGHPDNTYKCFVDQIITGIASGGRFADRHTVHQVQRRQQRFDQVLRRPQAWDQAPGRTCAEQADVGLSPGKFDSDYGCAFLLRSSHYSWIFSLLPPLHSRSTILSRKQ